MTVSWCKHQGTILQRQNYKGTVPALLTLLITGRKRRQHKTVSQISRKRFQSTGEPIKLLTTHKAAYLADNIGRHIWKQEWINKESEETGPPKSLKRKPPLMERGGRGENSSKQVGSFYSAPQRMSAQEQSPSLKVERSENGPFFLWTLTEKMKSLTEWARTSCLWISVFLL